MLARLMKVILIAIWIITIWGCSDDLTKTNDPDKYPRIEFSYCTACYECINDFNCPRDAIRIDELSGKVYIDQDRCISCYDCLNEFECRFEAITRLPDVISPASPQDMEIVSDSIGIVEINFTAPGDDSLLGIAYLYKLEILDITGNQVETDFIPPLPHYSGSPENWKIYGLPENDTLHVHISAKDEVGHISAPAEEMIIVKGEYIDDQAPVAITDLVTISEEYSITLHWTAPFDPDPRAGVTSYVVKSALYEITESNWMDAIEIEQGIVPQSPGSPEELILNYTEPSGELYFAIRSLDAADNISDLSNIATGEATTDITAPATITDLTTGTPGNITVPLSWTAPGDNGMEGQATRYEIRYALFEINSVNWETAIEFEQVMVPHPAGSSEMKTLTGLLPETVYYFAVKAVDEVNNYSDISNSASATTEALADTGAPAAITDLAAEINDPEIVLSWTATGDDGNTGTASEYEMRYAQAEITSVNWSDADQITGLPFPAEAGNIEDFSINYLSPGITWYFALIARDEAENSSELSNNAMAIIPLDEIPPAVITDLTATVQEEMILLNWTAPGDNGSQGIASSYDLRYSTELINDNNWDSADVIPSPSPSNAGEVESVELSDLEFNTTFYFAVKAEDDAGNISALSNVCDAIIEVEIDETPPAAITNLDVNDGQSVYNNRITINWTAPGDDGNTGTCSAYEIRYRSIPITAANWNTSTLFNSPPTPAPAGTNQTCQVTGLSAGQVYYFAVRALDEADNMGDISNSPGGKIVYQITASQCHDCNLCIGRCDQSAIYDAGPYKLINPDLCIACGECLICQWNAIHLWVIGY